MVRDNQFLLRIVPEPAPRTGEVTLDLTDLMTKKGGVEDPHPRHVPIDRPAAFNWPAGFRT